MLFKQTVLDGIRQGRITLAFRRWKRPTVKAGGTLQTPAGRLAIHRLEVITADQITAADAGASPRADLLDNLGSRGGELYRIEFERVGDDPRIALRAETQLSEAAIQSLHQRLQRLDAASATGPWTVPTLQLIADHPEQRARDLAAKCDRSMDWLKTNIRKLKNLGLTESLLTGY